MMSSQQDEPDEVFMSGDGFYRLQVVGESHYQKNLEDICGPRKYEGENFFTTANLVLEDDNPYDHNAIRVDIEGKQVGYLSREVAPILRQGLKELGHPRPTKITCKAKIVGGWVQNGEKGYYGVRLNIPYNEIEEPAPKRKKFLGIF